MAEGGGPVSRHLTVRGHVQGVGYRAWAEREALRRGLEGFVRNLRDGGVEMLLIGPPAAVEAMIEASRQGPPIATVWDVRDTPADPRVEALRRPGERFSVLPTA